jgi:gas vesicle protein
LNDKKVGKGEIKLTRKNQFWKGMLYGAIAGGVISLLDKETRQVMKENIQTASSKVFYVVRNPGEITERVKGTAGKLKETVEQVGEDISYIVGKVDELRELTPQVTDILKETKDTFSKNEESQLIEDVLKDK